MRKSILAMTVLIGAAILLPLLSQAASAQIFRPFFWPFGYYGTYPAYPAYPAYPPGYYPPAYPPAYPPPTYPPVYPPAYGSARPAPWTPQWYAYCGQRYRSFNARTGLYLGYDGQYHFCV